MFIFLKNTIKSEIQKIGIIKPFTYLLIIATVWYAIFFVLPNFYKSDENSKLDAEIQKLEDRIDELYKQDGAEAQTMAKEEIKRETIKTTKKTAIDEYRAKPEDKKVNAFNELFARNKKKLNE